MRSWRAPALPRARAMAVPLLGISVTCAVAKVGWSPAGQQTLQFVWGWLALDLLAYWMPLLGLPVLDAWGVAEPRCRWPLGARWGIYWGILGGLLVAGCAVRGWIAIHCFGAPIDGLTLFGPAPGYLVVVCGFEFHAAFHLAVRAQQAEIDAKLAALFLSQAAMLRARDRTADEVSAVALGQVAPVLAAASQLLRAQAEEARTGRRPPDATLGALASQLRQVNDEGLRQLSHLLHPSVIKLGLLPALRALAQHHDEQFGVDIHASRAVIEADRLLDGALLLDERLAIYRIVEAALDGVARHPESGGVVVGLSLLAPGLLGLGIEGSELGIGSASLAWTLFETRLEQAGGRWEVETALEGGTRLSASLPFGAQRGPELPPAWAAPAFGPFVSPP
jgi:hypothetical protein